MDLQAVSYRDTYSFSNNRDYSLIHFFTQVNLFVLIVCTFSIGESRVFVHNVIHLSKVVFFYRIIFNSGEGVEGGSQAISSPKSQG